MTRRIRMLAAAASLAVTGGLIATVAPAQAATNPVSVGFDCTKNIIGLLPVDLGTINLPMDLGVLDNLTVPVGSTIAPVTGTLGLAPLLSTVGTTLDHLVNVSSSLTATVGTTAVPLVLNAFTGAVQVPALPMPALPGPVPVNLTQGSISFGLLGGLLGGLIGTVNCVLPAASGQLANILVRTPSQISTGTTTGGGPISYGGGSTGGGALLGSTGGSGGWAGAGGSAGGQVANPCVQPLARAGRTAKVSARTTHRSVPSKVAPRIVVHTTRTARGNVVACYGTVPLARAALLLGRARLTLPRFYPGHYRITVRYLGAGQFRGASLKVPMGITH